VCSHARLVAALRSAAAVVTHCVVLTDDVLLFHNPTDATTQIHTDYECLPRYFFFVPFSALAGRKRREVAWLTDGGLDDMSANILPSTDFLLLGASCGQLPCPASLSVHPQSGAVRARPDGRRPSRNHGSGPPSVPLLACLLAILATPDWGPS
jgi:hypothetical protein